MLVGVTSPAARDQSVVDALWGTSDCSCKWFGIFSSNLALLFGNQGGGDSIDVKFFILGFKYRTNTMEARRQAV
jgi:hypothetical protein